MLDVRVEMDEAKYADWLANLEEGEEVALQEFVPPASVLGAPFERWRLTKGHINFHNGRPYIFSSVPDCPLLPDGRACYWNSDRESGQVFPARIVPLSPGMIASIKWGASIYIYRPFWEPLFIGGYRHVYVVDYGKLIDVNSRTLRKAYPRHYETDVEDGRKLVGFSLDEADLSLACDGLRYCYSESL